ncbi:Sodium/potassium-transporting ATPase subunit beta-1-interacting protein 3 [Manis javanica]|nr:Sodium/potassium-transporting ATPase subunit beta-1-interacting protein 3 [Manis javanica]
MVGEESCARVHASEGAYSGRCTDTTRKLGCSSRGQVILACVQQRFLGPGSSRRLHFSQVTALVRQVFDFLGYQWAPILATFIHIVVVIWGSVGPSATSPVTSQWGPDGSVLCGPPSGSPGAPPLPASTWQWGGLSKDSELLTFILCRHRSWWHEHGPVCLRKDAAQDAASRAEAADGELRLLSICGHGPGFPSPDEDTEHGGGLAHRRPPSRRSPPTGKFWGPADWPREVTALVRQVFNFLGYQWAPILATFIHIVVVIWGSVGPSATSPVTLQCVLCGPPSGSPGAPPLPASTWQWGGLSKDSELLTFNLCRHHSWWHEHGPGCLRKEAQVCCLRSVRHRMLHLGQRLLTGTCGYCPSVVTAFPNVSTVGPGSPRESDTTWKRGADEAMQIGSPCSTLQTRNLRWDTLSVILPEFWAASPQPCAVFQLVAFICACHMVDAATQEEDSLRRLQPLVQAGALAGVASRARACLGPQAALQVKRAQLPLLTTDRPAGSCFSGAL